MPDQSVKNDLILVIEHINEIENYFEEINSPNDFVMDKPGKAFFDAILMHLQVIGELLKKSYSLNEPLFLKYDKIPWSEIIRMRDLISHHYDKLQHDIVFDICKNALPDLKSCLQQIIKEQFPSN